jgi:hexosaminidase
LLISGHTQSWELGVPGLLVPCYSATRPNGLFGPMDPTNATLYAFLHKFFKEVTTVFPDTFVHIGGDEVDLKCW